MSATITVLRAGTEDSIEMYVEPEEKIKEVIERCQGYWQLEGDRGEYLLMKRNSKLISEKTVISSDLQDNDVVKFRKKSTIKENDSEKNECEDLTPDEILSLAERWLQNNIGVKSGNLELLEKQRRQSSSHLQFKNTESDEHYTILIKGRKVRTYIPALMDHIEKNQ